jgi:hypothetical protein
MGYLASSSGQPETTRRIFSELKVLIVGAGEWARKIESICKIPESNIDVSILPAREFISEDGKTHLELAEFDKIWICTRPGMQNQALAKLVLFKGEIILEKPYVETSRDYLKLFEILDRSDLNIVLSQPWTFSTGWRTYKSLLNKQKVEIFHISRLGSQAHSFINPVADWLPHDLNLILDFFEGNVFELNVHSISWNTSRDRVNFSLAVNEKYLFNIISGFHSSERIATWKTNDITFNFLNSELSSNLEDSKWIKESHPLLTFLRNRHTKNQVLTRRNLSFHQKIFSELGL